MKLRGCLDLLLCLLCGLAPSIYVAATLPFVSQRGKGWATLDVPNEAIALVAAPLLVVGACGFRALKRQPSARAENCWTLLLGGIAFSLVILFGLLWGPMLRRLLFGW